MKNRRNEWLMYALCFLQGQVFYGAIATLYRQAAGVSVFQITLIESISLALALALELPMGLLSEKIGYRRTMIFCNVLYFLSKVVFWRADGFGWFLLERLMLSVILAGLSGVDASILYLSCEKEHAHKAFGVYNGMGTAGLLTAAAVYSLCIGARYRLAGLLTVCSYGLAMVLTFFLQEVHPEERKTPVLREFREILGDTFKNGNALLFLLAAALVRECNQTITVFLNQLQYVRAGLSNRAIGFAYIAMTAAGMCSVGSAAFIRRTGEKRGGALLIAFCGACCVLLARTTNAALSLVGIFGLHIACSLLQPLFDVLENRQVTHRNRATALSIYAMLMDSVAILTNLLFGKASDIALPLAFGLGAFFCAVALVLYGITADRLRQ